MPVPRVLGYGDNIVDRFTDRGVDFPGGNCVNVAVMAHRLGADAGYLGVFGDDALGARLRSAVAAEGVDLTGSVVRPGESGVSMLEVRDGERHFMGWNGGGVTVREPVLLDAETLAHVEGFSLVHSSVYSATEGELPRIERALVSFDLSSEDEFREPAYLARVCPSADLVLMSCGHLDERSTLDAITVALNAGAGMVLATRGAEGAIVADDRRLRRGEALLVDADRLVDTMGCGDAFLAGFVVSLLEAGWQKTATPTDAALGAALIRGAEAARDQCLVRGAFGRGWPVFAD